jgi:hypothetical protein
VARRAARRTPRRGRSRRGGGGGQTALGIVLILLVLGALGFGGYEYLEATRNAVELDEATLCPVRDGIITPAGYAAIVIDTSDELPVVQRQNAENELTEAVRGVPQGWRVSIYGLATDPAALPRPVIQLCNPGDGADLDTITANPTLARETWTTKFVEPMQRAVMAGVAGAPADTSPIMETIAAIAAAEIATPAARRAPRTLVILSDMLQHSALASHYRAPPDFAAIEASDAWQHLRADLSDVKVTVFYIDRAREAGLDWNAHVRFWEAYFDAQGATLDRVRRVLG